MHVTNMHTSAISFQTCTLKSKILSPAVLSSSICLAPKCCWSECPVWVDNCPLKPDKITEEVSAEVVPLLAVLHKQIHTSKQTSSDCKSTSAKEYTHSDQLVAQIMLKKQLDNPGILGTSHVFIFFCLFLIQTWYFTHSCLPSSGLWCCKAVSESHFQWSSFFSASQIINCSPLLQVMGVHVRVSMHYLSTGWAHSELMTLERHCKGL